MSIAEWLARVVPGGASSKLAQLIAGGRDRAARGN
jgi:hypothetical protein